MENKPNLRSSLKAYGYLLPALLVIIVFTIYPLIKLFMTSFYLDYNFITGEVSQYGFDNFVYLFNDPLFMKAMKNTFMYVLFVVPLSVIISLFIAVLLNSNIKFKKTFQTIFFLPYVTSIVAIGIVWSWMFHSSYGLINYFLGWFGIEAVQWLNDPSKAMWALIIFAIWKSLAFNIIIFLAGLQNIDKQYYDAAQIDSTPKWRVFTKITVPLVSPMIAYTSIMGLISSFKVYTEVYALFPNSGGGGTAGPANSAITMVYYIYDKFYGSWNFGVASAAALVLFLIILLFTGIQLYISKKKVHY